MWRHTITVLILATLTSGAGLSRANEIPTPDSGVAAGVAAETAKSETTTGKNGATTASPEIAPDFNEAIDKAVKEDRSTPEDDKLHQQVAKSRYKGDDHGRSPAKAKKKKKGGSKKSKKKKKKRNY